MNIKELFTDDEAVSPVIGVILMVAITVILAAVIGAFVLNIGGNQEVAPSVSVDFENTSDGVRVSHGGGDPVDPARLTLLVNGSGVSGSSISGDANLGDEWKGGEAFWVTNDGSLAISDSSTADASLDSNSKISIRWDSESGDKSTVLGEFTTG